MSNSQRKTDLILDTAGLHLVSKKFSTALLGLRLVNIFHQDALVLEDVALGLLIQRMVTEDMGGIFSTRRCNEYEPEQLTGGDRFCQLLGICEAIAGEHVAAASREPCLAYGLQRYPFVYQGQCDDPCASPRECPASGHGSE